MNKQAMLEALIKQSDIVKLRDDGNLTFREIGERYGFSASRAMQLYRKAKRSEHSRKAYCEDTHWVNYLSREAATVIMNEFVTKGIAPTREAVLVALRGGELERACGMTYAAFVNICAYFECTPATYKDPLSTKRPERHPLFGISPATSIEKYAEDSLTDALSNALSAECSLSGQGLPVEIIARAIGKASAKLIGDLIINNGETRLNSAVVTPAMISALEHTTRSYREASDEIVRHYRVACQYSEH